MYRMFDFLFLIHSVRWTRGSTETESYTLFPTTEQVIVSYV